MAFPVEALVALLGLATGIEVSSSMSDVSGVTCVDGLLLKSGDTPVLGVPKVVEREGVRVCLDLAMMGMRQGLFLVEGSTFSRSPSGASKLISLMAWKMKFLDHMIQAILRFNATTASTALLLLVNYPKIP